MIKITQKGNFEKANSYLERLKELVRWSILDKYGNEGVRLLSLNTPRDSGLAASSWFYKIEHDKKGAKLSWYNSDVENGCNVIILIQYGHATKNGGFVHGTDFINPVIEGMFKDLGKEIEKEMNKL